MKKTVTTNTTAKAVKTAKANTKKATLADGTKATVAAAVIEAKQLAKADDEKTQATALANAAAAASFAPNAKFPFGIKFVDAGVVSYERYKTDKERERRMASCKKLHAQRFMEAMNFAAPASDQAIRPAAMAGAALVLANELDAAKKDGRSTNTAKRAAVAKAKLAAAKQDDAPKELRVRLDKSGIFCFGASVAQRLNGVTHVLATVKGNTITLAPCAKNAPGAAEITQWSGRPVLRFKEQLAAFAITPKKYAVTASAVGQQGLALEVR